MGHDDMFKKRREDRRRRKHEFKKARTNSYLIVTEGKRTEPLYFKGLERYIKSKIGGNVDVVEMPVIDVNGEGCSTGKRRGYHVAWSNESFEYWLYLHFQYNESALH